jgi:hypothetical protein
VFSVQYSSVFCVNKSSTVFNIKYSSVFCVNKSSNSVQHKVTVGRCTYTKYWGILYVEHCGNIYLHKILGITLCWALWENVLTKNTGVNKYSHTVQQEVIPSILCK